MTPINTTKPFWLRLAAAAVCFVPTLLSAQIGYTGGVYYQNFDSLAGNAAAGTAAPAAWTNNSTLPGWYASETTYKASNATSGTTPTAALFASTATAGSNTGLFSFGTSNTSDRALGSRPVAGGSAVLNGVRLINNTSQTLTSATVTFTGEQWFKSGKTTADTILVDYQTGASSIAAGTWTNVPALLFTSGLNTATAATVAGNTVGTNRQGYGAKLTGLNWAPGAELWVRFNDTDNTGDEQGMAIDEFAFTAEDEPGLFFNGKSSYVTMGQGAAAAAAFGASSFTVECRFLRTGTGVTASSGSGGVTAVPLIARGVGEGDGSNIDANYFLGIDATGKLAADFEQLNATNNGPNAYLAGQNFPVTGSTTLLPGVFYHVAATYDAATATWALYVNGVAETLTTVLPAFVGVVPRADSIQGLGIGTTINSTGARAGFFHGIIDEARIWNVARSAADILANKDSELAAGPGLLARYGMDEASGTALTGTIGSGASAPNGTLAGTVLPARVNAAAFAPNAAPAVALDPALNGSTVIFPANAIITATASDTTPGSVIKVEFFNGTTKLGESLASPYTLTLTRPAEGSYTITAVATDNNGAVTTSAPATFTVVPNPQLPPTVNLAGPADLLTGAGSSVTLSADISDPENNNSTVTFYGRKRAPLVPGPDFIIGTLPDTQYYSQNAVQPRDRDAITGVRADMFFSQTNWFVNNRDTLNLAFVSHQGDMVQEGNNGFAAANYATDHEWRVANKAMAILEDQPSTLRAYGIPWGGAPGNHDQTTVGALNAPNEKWNMFFGTNRWANKPYFKGSFSANNSNNYQFFSSGGLDFIIFHFDFSSAAAVNTGINAGVIEWADALMKAHPHRRAIITSHYLLDAPPATTVAVAPNLVPAPFGGPGQRFFDEFKDNPNFFMMWCGHIHNEGRRVETFQGRTIYACLQDYQGRNGSGNGWLRYYVFSPANNTITAKTYNPVLGIFETGGDFDEPSIYDTRRNEASEFVMPYNMQGSVSPWIALGTVSNHPSGSAASLSWTGLEKDSTYEWYAAADDGIYTGSSAVRTFSTALNPAPAIAITSPSNGDIIAQPTQVTVTANPTDDGSIAKVEFYQGNTRLAEVTSAPWTYSFTAATGPQTLTAIATDNNGSYTLSNVVSVTVNNPNNAAPATTLTAPVDNATVLSGNVTLTATATDSDGTISKVEFYSGTTKIGQSVVSPYTLVWAGVPIGTYTLTAVATDNEFATTTSSAITLNVVPAAPFIASYSQNFDIMGTAGTTPPPGWSVWNNTSGSNGTWSTSIPASAMAPLAIVTNALSVATPPTGNQNNGYNAGLAATPTDRMLGSAPTGNAGTAFQVELTNTSGAALSVVNLAYDIQRFNAPTSVNELPGYWVFHSLDNGATWTNAADLNPVLAAPGKAIVPNTMGLTTVSGSNIVLSGPWNNNSTLRLRWVDDNGIPTSPDQIYGLNNVVVLAGVNAASALTAAPVNPSGISLTWIENATNETGIRIERKLSSDTAWTPLTELAANAVSHLDPTAAAGISYDYRVAAFNASVTADPSNTATAAAYTPIQVWKLLYLGSATIPDNTDSDGDGLSNAQEFIIGTNPATTGDTPRISALTPQPDGSVVLQLQTISGKSYLVEANNDFPAGPWTTVAASVSGTGLIVTVPDAAAAGEPDRVYRVTVLP